MRFQNKILVRDRKAFTLVEVVVSMALTVIVLSLAVSFVSLITKFSAIQQTDYESNMEYRSVVSLLDEYKDTYSVYGYSIDAITSRSISITDGIDIYDLTFDEVEHILHAKIKESDKIVDKTVSLSQISSIIIESSDKVVNVTMTFLAYPTRQYLVNFGAVL